MVRDWGDRADELASEAFAAGEPTAWFDRLYGEGERGEVSLPWDRSAPSTVLTEWARSESLSGDGRRAVVVGCGLGADAEYLSSLGFAVTAFDVSSTAVRVAMQRHPGSAVDYRQADLLALPTEWLAAFNLVVEIFTIQALPEPPRAQAIRGVTSLVGPGGTLLAVAFRTDQEADASTGPPFALSRGTMRSLAGESLVVVEVATEGPGLWRAVLRDPR
jgi:SAM-dependent methyltransferase